MIYFWEGKWFLEESLFTLLFSLNCRLWLSTWCIGRLFTSRTFQKMLRRKILLHCLRGTRNCKNSHFFFGLWNGVAWKDKHLLPSLVGIVSMSCLIIDSGFEYYICAIEESCLFSPLFNMISCKSTDTETSSKALQLLNGYMLKGKPMVIEFGHHSSSSSLRLSESEVIDKIWGKKICKVQLNLRHYIHIWNVNIIYSQVNQSFVY